MRQVDPVPFEGFADVKLPAVRCVHRLAIDMLPEIDCAAAATRL
jgi:hypothetical protein